jgi:hypothetical protein
MYIPLNGIYYIGIDYIVNLGKIPNHAIQLNKAAVGYTIKDCNGYFEFASLISLSDNKCSRIRRLAACSLKDKSIYYSENKLNWNIFLPSLVGKSFMAIFNNLSEYPVIKPIGVAGKSIPTPNKVYWNPSENPVPPIKLPQWIITLAGGQQIEYSKKATRINEAIEDAMETLSAVRKRRKESFALWLNSIDKSVA